MDISACLIGLLRALVCCQRESSGSKIHSRMLWDAEFQYQVKKKKWVHEPIVSCLQFQPKMHGVQTPCYQFLPQLLYRKCGFNFVPFPFHTHVQTVELGTLNPKPSSNCFLHRYHSDPNVHCVVAEILRSWIECECHGLHVVVGTSRSLRGVYFVFLRNSREAMNPLSFSFAIG